MNPAGFQTIKTISNYSGSFRENSIYRASELFVTKNKKPLQYQFFIDDPV